MTDRIGDYLCRKVSADKLAADERSDAETLDQAVAATRAFVEARPVPDFASRVMRRIDHDALRPRSPGAWHRLIALLWAPRPLSIQWRPAYAVAGAAAIVLLASMLPVGGSPPIGPQPPAAQSQVLVQFRFQAPDASDVRLAGSFTNWQPEYQLHQVAAGVWTLTIPLSPGVHDYAFVVDGRQWVADPYAPQIDDGFGGRSSRIALLAPGEPQL